MKRPVPEVPSPGWSDVKDLQEWEKYHQVRADDDKTSNTLASIADAIHHMPGGWIVFDDAVGGTFPGVEEAVHERMLHRPGYRREGVIRHLQVFRRET